MADVDVRDVVRRTVARCCERPGVSREARKCLVIDTETIVGHVLNDLTKDFGWLSELARVAAIGVAADSVKAVDRKIEERAAPVPEVKPALEPRRTMGAVVRSCIGREFVVVSENRSECQRILDRSYETLWPFHESDRFVRWAGGAECALHEIPFVDRTPPAATPAHPVDAAGRPLWVRITGPEDADFVTIGKVYHVKGWDKTSPEIVNDKGVPWCLAGEGGRVEATWPAWEPCAAPTLKFEIPEVRPGRPQSKPDAKPEPEFTEGEAVDLMRALVTAGRNGMLLAPVVNEAIRARGAK